MWFSQFSKNKKHLVEYRPETRRETKTSAAWNPADATKQMPWKQQPWRFFAAVLQINYLDKN
jgi:hypothetical protein